MLHGGDGCRCLSAEEFFHLVSVVGSGRWELVSRQSREQVNTRYSWSYQEHPINDRKTPHLMILSVSIAWNLHLYLLLLCNIIRTMNEWITVFLLLLLSSSGASVVAIDNKIEQAMVSLSGISWLRSLFCFTEHHLYITWHEAFWHYGVIYGWFNTHSYVK